MVPAQWCNIWKRLQCSCNPSLPRPAQLISCFIFISLTLLYSSQILSEFHVLPWISSDSCLNSVLHLCFKLCIQVLFTTCTVFLFSDSFSFCFTLVWSSPYQQSPLICSFNTPLILFFQKRILPSAVFFKFLRWNTICSWSHHLVLFLN